MKVSNKTWFIWGLTTAIGVWDSEYTREELSQLCNEMKYDIFWGCITDGVW